jgi:hypothetical protein
MGAGLDIVEVRFGKQLDTKVLQGAENGPDLEPGQVAAYVAKYACTGSHEQITRRDATPDQLRDNGVPEQLVQMAIAAIHVSERTGLQRVAKGRHMLGLRGHFVTKSRGYSTTLGTLRNDRAQWRADRDQADDDNELEGQTTPVLSAWEYLGSGYLNPGDVLLAAGVDARDPGWPGKHCVTCGAAHPGTPERATGVVPCSLLVSRGRERRRQAGHD